MRSLNIVMDKIYEHFSFPGETLNNKKIIVLNYCFGVYKYVLFLLKHLKDAITVWCMMQEFWLFFF